MEDGLLANSSQIPPGWPVIREAGGTRCFTDATLVIGSPGLMPGEGPVLTSPRQPIERAFSRHVGPRLHCLYLRTRVSESSVSGQCSDSYFPLYIGLAGDGEVMALARLIQTHTQWSISSPERVS